MVVANATIRDTSLRKRPMPLIIDGYNLLYAAGMVSSVEGDGSFEADRMALLDALLAVIDANELHQTVVVFDSANPPPGLPKSLNYHEISVRFSSDYPDADTMIEELVQLHHAPKRLTVVSSDHRVQRAARRRKAKAIDSGSWYRLMRQSRKRKQQQLAQQPPKQKQPTAAVPRSEVQRWLQFFGDIDLADLKPASPEVPTPSPAPNEDPKVNPSSTDHATPAAKREPASPQVFSEDYLKRIAEEFFGPDDSV